MPGTNLARVVYIVKCKSFSLAIFTRYFQTIFSSKSFRYMYIYMYIYYNNMYYHDTQYTCIIIHILYTYNHAHTHTHIRIIYNVSRTKEIFSFFFFFYFAKFHNTITRFLRMTRPRYFVFLRLLNRGGILWSVPPLIARYPSHTIN